MKTGELVFIKMYKVINRNVYFFEIMRMSKMNGARKYRIIVALLFSAALSGCSFLDVAKGNATRIDGQVYYFNEDGEIELTERELEQLEAEKKVVRIKHVAPDGALIIDPEELSVLMQDREVFFSAVDNTVGAGGSVSVLVKKGSLQENINRLADKEGWASVTWNAAHDYYVKEPFAVKGQDLPSVIVEVLKGFPLNVSFVNTETDKKITIN